MLIVTSHFTLIAYDKHLNKFVQVNTALEPETVSLVEIDQRELPTNQAGHGNNANAVLLGNGPMAGYRVVRLGNSGRVHLQNGRFLSRRQISARWFAIVRMPCVGRRFFFVKRRKLFNWPLSAGAVKMNSPRYSLAGWPN